MHLHIRIATKHDRTLLSNLFQFYVYDFSEFEEPGSTKLAFNKQGQFNTHIGPNSYWDQPDRWAYLIEVDANPAGFALVNTISHAESKIDFNMAEFFVARKYRRHGVATAAFHHVLENHIGRWEIAIVEANVAAQKFWPAAIRRAHGTSQPALVPHDANHWRGPIWTFVKSPSR